MHKLGIFINIYIFNFFSIFFPSLIHSIYNLKHLIWSYSLYVVGWLGFFPHLYSLSDEQSDLCVESMWWEDEGPMSDVPDPLRPV